MEKISVDEGTHQEVTLTVTQARDVQSGGEWPDELADAWDEAQGYAFGSHGRPATLLIRIQPDNS